MTLFTATDLRQRAGGVTASAAQVELKHAAGTSRSSFDVFLSHSVRDATLVYGLMQWLESQGLSVYVDWIVDTQLDRSKVSPATAAMLRRRITQSRSLVYATSRSASRSRWMPWELGYFDGHKDSEQIAICPIETGDAGGFVGEEYLGLYKQLEKLFVDQRPVPYVTRRVSGVLQAQRVSSFAHGVGGFTRVSNG